jgi:hypothetical protein
VCFKVKVFLGDSDITSQFEFQDVLVKGDGPPGLQSLYYRIEAYSKALSFDFSHSERILKCFASLQTADLPDYVHALSTEKSTNISVTLLCEFSS